MSDQISKTNLAWLDGVQRVLLPPTDGILELGRSLQKEINALDAAALFPSAELIVSTAENLREEIEKLSGGVTAGEIFDGRSPDEAARFLRHELRNSAAAVKDCALLLLADIDDLGEGSFRSGVEELIDLTGSLLLQLKSVVEFSVTEERLQTDGTVVAPILVERMSAAVAGRAHETGHVLVVDDLQSNRDALARHLSREGHTVTVADGGRQGLAAADKESFDLVLLDLMMPDLDGFGVLARLKADDRLCEIPVIMVSADDEEESVIRCIEAGADDYLMKPVNPVLLRARISACLDRKYGRDREKSYLSKLEVEQQKSTNLLLNILPPQIVERINAGEELIADRFDNVNVLFSDLVGFTKISAQMGPSALVNDLNLLFSRYDAAGKQHGVEKIKTIGDAYLVVSGLPNQRPDHIDACADMALSMVAILDEVNPDLTFPFEIRIGIHTGPVVAGIIGTHKFVYDVWGTTVNTASRYESYSAPGRIHVSNQVAEPLQGKFELESRGLMEMRGLGEVESFFLKGRIDAS